ncbi:MAG: hypothetical protein AAEJ04_09375, partial [Planctomycetota bacterium]
AALSILALAILVLLERVFAFQVSDEIVYGLPASLFLMTLLFVYLSIRSIPVVEAVEAERAGSIPQTISTSLFASQSGFSEEVATKIIAEAEVLAEDVNVRGAVPLGRPGHLARVTFSLGVLLLSLIIPPLDLLGLEEEALQKQRQADRVVRKEASLQRRLREVSTLAERHQVNPETRKLLTRISKKPEGSPASGTPSQKPAQKNAQERAREVRKDVANRLDREALAAARNTAERVRRSAERSGKPQSKEGQEFEQAMRKGDLGRAAQELQKLAEAAGQEGEAGDKARSDLAKMADSLGLPEELASKFAQKKSSRGESGGQPDPDDLKKLARELDQLARLMRESELLDHALEQIQFTEAELSSLPSEWPEGPPPKICPDCLSGI